jgi:hypothetical protein
VPVPVPVTVPVPAPVLVSAPVPAPMDKTQALWADLEKSAKEHSPPPARSQRVSRKAARRGSIVKSEIRSSMYESQR